MSGSDRGTDTTLPVPNLEDELVQLLDEGLIFDRSEKPIRPVVTIVGTQRAGEDLLLLAEDFLVELVSRYPNARLVIGDTSNVEKAAVATATMLGVPYEVVEKAEKGEWDAGGNIRDERVVAKASHVVALDESARSKNYQALAARTGKHFSRIASDKATNRTGETHDRDRARTARHLSSS